MTPIKTALLVTAAACLVACQEPNAPQRAPAVEAAPPAAAPPVAESTPAAEAPPAPTFKGVDVSTALDQTYCNVESIGGSDFVAGPLNVQSGQQIRGWLGHAVAGTIESPQLLFIDATGAAVAGVELKLSVVRDDVANVHGGRADLKNSGFEAPLPALPPASYKLLLHYAFDGKTYRCDNGRQVIVH